MFSYDPEGNSLEGLGFGKGDGQGLTVGGGAEDLGNGWEGKAVGRPLVCARWGSAALVPLLRAPSPGALQAGVSCPSLPGQAWHLWTLNFRGGSTCRDGAVVATGG